MYGKNWRENLSKQKIIKLKDSLGLGGQWTGLTSAPKDTKRRGHTSESAKALKDTGLKLTQIPKGFNLHPKLTKFNDQRIKAIKTGQGIDWSFAEALAFGSLLREGFKVRLSLIHI